MSLVSKMELDNYDDNDNDDDDEIITSLSSPSPSKHVRTSASLSECYGLQREKQTDNEEKRRAGRIREKVRGRRAKRGALLYVPLAVRILVISSFACANYVTF